MIVVLVTKLVMIEEWEEPLRLTVYQVLCTIFSEMDLTQKYSHLQLKPPLLQCAGGSFKY